MGLFSKIFGSFRRSAKVNTDDREWGLSHVTPGDDEDVLDLSSVSAMALPYGDESFGLVTVFDPGALMPDPERSIGEIRRVLRKGGRLLIAVGPAGRKVFTANGLRKILRELDFSVVKIDDDEANGRLAAVAVK